MALKLLRASPWTFSVIKKKKESDFKNMKRKLEGTFYHHTTGQSMQLEPPLDLYVGCVEHK